MHEAMHETMHESIIIQPTCVTVDEWRLHDVVTSTIEWC